jgi:hypothetical protein
MGPGRPGRSAAEAGRPSKALEGMGHATRRVFAVDAHKSINHKRLSRCRSEVWRTRGAPDETLMGQDRDSGVPRATRLPAP